MLMINLICYLVDVFFFFFASTACVTEITKHFPNGNENTIHFNANQKMVLHTQKEEKKIQQINGNKITSQAETNKKKCGKRKKATKFAERTFTQFKYFHSDRLIFIYIIHR